MSSTPVQPYETYETRTESSGKLRVENSKLPEFRGNAIPHSTEITPDDFLELL
jgi:hypothetical protein